MASIPIYNIPNYKQYTAGAAQDTFTYPFPIFNDTDILVYSREAADVADDATDIDVLNLDYTVTDVGNENGGTVVFTTPFSGGQIITLVRREPISRTTNLVQSFNADDINFALNNLVLFIQQNQNDILARSPRYQDSAEVEQDDIDIPILGPNQIWRKDPAGTSMQPFTLEVDDPSLNLATYIGQIASNGTGDGASLVGFDPAGTVQSVLAQNNTDTDANTTFITDLQSTTTSEGASLVGTDDGFLNVQASIDDLRIRETYNRTILPYGMYGTYTSPTTFQIEDGNIRSDDGQVQIVLTSPIIKTGGAWTEGSGNGSIVNGVTFLPITSYYVFAISKANGTADVALDSDITGANVLVDPNVISAGYIHKQMIWSFKSNMAGNGVLAFYRFYNEYWYTEGQTIATGLITPGTTFNALIPGQTNGFFNTIGAVGQPSPMTVYLYEPSENMTGIGSFGVSTNQSDRQNLYRHYTKSGNIAVALTTGSVAPTQLTVNTWGYEYMGVPL